MDLSVFLSKPEILNWCRGKQSLTGSQVAKHFRKYWFSRAEGVETEYASEWATSYSNSKHFEALL